MAEGVLRKLAAEAGGMDLLIASAGIRAAAGQPADPRAVAAARSRGIDLSRHASRDVTVADIGEFDLILAMERRHVEAIGAMAGLAGAPCDLLIRYAPGHGDEIPDPFDGTAADYLHALDSIERACRGVVASLTPTGGPRPRRGDGPR